MACAGWLAWRESSRKAPQANRAATAGTTLPRTTLNPGALLESTLPDLSGREVAFKQFLGQPIVVNFWATWCAPCVQEMPDLDLMALTFQKVHFVGIGIDTVDNIRQFVDKIKVSYPLLIAGNAGISMMRELGNPSGGLPFTVMFDAEGNMIDTVLGQVKPDALRTQVESLVTKSRT